MPTVPFRALTLIFCTLIWASCSPDTVGNESNGCSSQNPCDAGMICGDDGICYELCQSDSDCPLSGACSGGDESKVCNGDICVPGCRDMAPIITAIDGNGSVDNGPDDARGLVSDHHIADGFIISGENLAGATVELVGGSVGTLVLDVVAAGDALQASIPSSVDVGEGQYTLVVRNAVDSAQASVWVVRGEQGPAGADGTDGATPTQSEIQDAVRAMDDLDVPTLAGRAANGYQRTDTWGRYFEAEDPFLHPGDVVTGSVASEDTASAGAVRQLLYGDDSGRGLSLGQVNLGEPIAKGRALISMRIMYAATIDPGAATYSQTIVDLQCAHIPNDGSDTWIAAGGRSLAPKDFKVANVWQTFDYVCDYAPDDIDQFAGMNYFQNIGEILIDSLRVVPLEERYPHHKDIPAFLVYNNYGGNQSVTGSITGPALWPGNVESFDNGDCWDNTNFKFTAPVAGFYFFSWNAFSNTTASRTFLFKNGSTVMQTNGNGKGIAVTLHLSRGDEVYLGAATENYSMHWYGSSGHNQFSGHLISATE